MRNFIKNNPFYVYLNIVLSIILISSSCGPAPAYDKYKCLESVQKQYPKAIVWRMPDKGFDFIVCDTNGAVYHIRTMDEKSTKITSKVVIKYQSN